MKHVAFGTFFDELVSRRPASTVHLGRPLDIDPASGTHLDTPHIAALVRRTAARLHAAGLRPGDRVAVVKRNHWDYVLLAAAAARIGALPALISGSLPADSLATVLTRFDPALIVTQRALLERAARDGADLTTLAPRTLSLDGPAPGTLPADADSDDSDAPAPHHRADDAPLLVLHTSGTTGVPKLAVHSTTTLLRRLASFEAHPWPVIAARRTDTVASAIAFSHGRAVTWTAAAFWLAPREFVLLTDSDPGRAAALLRAHPPTVMEALPATYVRWQPLAERAAGWSAPGAEVPGWDAPVEAPAAAEPSPAATSAGGGKGRARNGKGRGGAAPTAAPAAAAPVAGPVAPGVLHGAGAAGGNPFRDIRLFISTFDAVHPPTVRTFLQATRRRTPVWMQGWGQTETGPLTFRFLTRRALTGPAGRHPTTRDLGRPAPGRVALRVVDPVSMAPVPRGRPGLILARTSARCLGYVGEDHRWAEKSEGEWFNTGDIGVLTRTGALRLHDREVDMASGTSCVELEDVLHDRLPQVEEAVVLAAGDRLLPVLVTRDGTLDDTAWEHAVRDLPPFAEPLVIGRDAVPRTGTGKVRRHELRDRYLQGAARVGTGRWT
jgi:acyl-coenzyme A synthetase/AMP-(fatty) acid ligase